MENHSYLPKPPPIMQISKNIVAIRKGKPVGYAMLGNPVSWALNGITEIRRVAVDGTYGANGTIYKYCATIGNMVTYTRAEKCPGLEWAGYISEKRKLGIDTKTGRVGIAEYRWTSGTSKEIIDALNETRKREKIKLMRKLFGLEE